MSEQPPAVHERPPEWGKTAYEVWLENEDAPVIRGLAVEDVMEVPVAPWARKGAAGAIIKLIGSEHLNDAYVLELAPGSSSKPQRHFFEETVYVLSGRGALTVWNDRKDEQSFEWQAGSLFSIPLNAHHQFHNGSGTEPARYLAVTTLPLYLNLVHDEQFVFGGCPYDFLDRFAGREGHFNGEGTSYTGRIWEANFIPDVKNLRLQVWKERGAGGRNVMLELGNSGMGSHISEFPVGTYKKAHRHGPGAHVTILAGEGFSLMWKDGEEFQRVDWKPGSVLVPPDRWFHQHFNTGSTPARYLALRASSTKRPTFKNTERAVQTSVKLGGDQIEYEDQDTRIHQMFVEACRQRGVDVQMQEFLKA